MICHFHLLLIFVIIPLLVVLLSSHPHLPGHVHDPGAHTDHRLLLVLVVAPHRHVVGSVHGARGVAAAPALTEAGHVATTATEGDREGVKRDLATLDDRVLVV